MNSASFLWLATAMAVFVTANSVLRAHGVAAQLRVLLAALGVVAVTLIAGRQEAKG